MALEDWPKQIVYSVETIMIYTRILSALLAIALVLGPETRSGELAPGLRRLAASDKANKTIKVWIKLPKVGHPRSLKSSLGAQAITRAARHRALLGRMKSDHALSQKGLLDRLQEMRAVGKAGEVHTYWIVNVVEAEIAAGDLPALAARQDVEYIQQVPEIQLIEPIESGVVISGTGAGMAEDNLRYVRADEAWAAGYTGKGRLICSFDSGVEGSHDALKDSWKGNDGDSAAAWFDPIFDQPFPHTQPVVPNHGTHVMGILVGRNDITGDTTGVAPDAQWISAAVIDIGPATSAVLRAFEWAANPDGNPNTVDDVPDVINHSWGWSRFEPNDWQIFCQDIVFDAIDNTEALGIVNIFSAGNSGLSGAQSITNPANRANDSLDNFAVGNVDHIGDTIVLSSSRGPSDCPGGGIKPNVVAPGWNIRSTWPGNTYSLLGGTSMAAPHVSGLVALLRQKNPNATVEQIKEAIHASAISLPAHGSLPNDTYGWGLVDCMAALDYIEDPEVSLNVRVYEFDHASLSPGDTLEGTVVAECLGGNVDNVAGIITGNDPSLTILQDSVFFGNLLHGDTVRSTDTIRIAVSDTVTPGRKIPIDFLITGTGLSLTVPLHVVLDPLAAKTIVTHNTGFVQVSISNFGLFGMGPGSYGVPGPGVGFVVDDGPNELFEAGIMVGNSLTRVSSAVHSYVYEPDNDFRIAPGGNLQFYSPGTQAAEQSFSIFNDSNATDPLGLEIIQESFADTGDNSDFIILRYILRNMNGAPLNDIYFGLFFNWDVLGYYNMNIGGYETLDEFLWTAYYNGGAPIHYRGLKVIQGPIASALTGNETASGEIALPSQGGNGYETYEKYLALVNGFISADIYRNTPAPLYQVIAAGPLDFSGGGIDTVAFAIMADTSFEQIQDAAVRASSVLTDVNSPGREILPGAFSLHQNYPNPFNNSTTILFELPRTSSYRFSIYNVLGQLVHQESGEAHAGLTSIRWNAGEFSSGVYFYKVTVGNESATNKMLLLK